MMQLGQNCEPVKCYDRRRYFVMRAAVLILLIGIYGGRASGQEDIPLEYRIKATFLYNFAKLVEWPAGSFSEENPELIITVVGAGPVGEALDNIASDEKRGGRKLVIKRLKWNEELKRSHILFVSRSEQKHLKEILLKVDGAGVLTVSEIEGFASSGGMIGFSLVENKICFDINLNAAQRANLKISSRLLLLAKMVIGDGRQG